MKITSKIRSISPFASLVVAAFFLAIGGLAIGVSRHNAKIARIVASVKISPIAAAPDAYVALEGRVKAINGQKLAAPATRSACCWFRVTVQEHSYRDRDQEEDVWNTISEYSSSEPFLIQDATGEVAVYPSKAEITPTDHSVWYGPTAIPQDRNPPRYAPGGSDFAETNGPSLFRYTEERIYDGDPLYVLGTLSSKSNGRPDKERAEDDSVSPNPEDEDFSLVSPDDQRAAVMNGHWLGQSRFKELDRMVKSITSKGILATNSKLPFLLSALPREKMVEGNRWSSTAALFFAAFPVGLAALFLWFRFGPSQARSVD